ncbi:hypothetical protein ACFWN2_04885 [Lentzea sp. NPDC058436]|uniref:hypothetical protein n=1 Tax=Lentzea sp. NPDC058436 TaxID=3346499 RepID=UPI00364A1037
MRFPGDSTWAVSSGDGDTFALYVRDALGIRTPTADSIPRLTPPVPRVHDVYVPETFGSAWDRWWSQSYASRGAQHVPSRWPVGLPGEVRAAYEGWRPHIPDVAPRTRENFSAVLREVVTQLTEEIGREPVFSLSLIAIPVEGQFWRRVGSDSVLLSEELMASPHLIAPLESVIRDLVK